jgi:hypothetical protein
LIQYLGRFERWRGALGELPGWARVLVFLAALPGLIVMALSAVGFVVSLLALLLLAAPVYQLVSRLSDWGPGPTGETGQPEPRGRRVVEARVVDQG